MKINTAICKQELDDNLPAEYGTSRKGWKRTSRKGTAKTQIIRVFEHRELPVIGVVVEEDGEITSVRYSPKAAPEEETFDGPVSNEYGSADQYYFCILNAEEEGVRTFAIVSIDHWHKQQCLGENVGERTMKGMLPPGCGESMESFFESLMEREPLRKALLARGFKENDGFHDFIADGW